MTNSASSAIDSSVASVSTSDSISGTISSVVSSLSLDSDNASGSNDVSGMSSDSVSGTGSNNVSGSSLDSVFALTYELSLLVLTLILPRDVPLALALDMTSNLAPELTLARA